MLVSLYMRDAKKCASKYVHRLVLAAFIGIEDDMHVNHINHQRDDNRLINLEYLSHRDNQADGQHRQSIREKLQGGIGKRAVKNIDTGEIFESIMDASRHYGNCKNSEICIRQAAQGL